MSPRTYFYRLAGLVLIGGLCTLPAIAQAQQAPRKQPGTKPANPAAAAPAKFRLSERTPYLGLVNNVAADGAVTVSPFPGGPGGPPVELTEGYYLGLAMPELKMPFEKATLVRDKSRRSGQRAVQWSAWPKAAAGLVKPGQVLILVRPIGATTAQLKAGPTRCRS